MQLLEWKIPLHYIFNEVNFFIEMLKKNLRNNNNCNLSFEHDLLNKIIFLFFLHNGLIKEKSFIASLAIVKMYCSLEYKNEIFNQFCNQLFNDEIDTNIIKKIHETYQTLSDFCSINTLLILNNDSRSIENYHEPETENPQKFGVHNEETKINEEKSKTDFENSDSILMNSKRANPYVNTNPTEKEEKSNKRKKYE